MVQEWMSFCERDIGRRVEVIFIVPTRYSENGRDMIDKKERERLREG